MECREKGAIDVLVLVKDLMAAMLWAYFECNFYLVQLIRTTNTNPQYLQRIFVYLLFDYFYQVKFFTQDKDTPKNASITIYIKNFYPVKTLKKWINKKFVVKTGDSYWLFYELNEVL